MTIAERHKHILDQLRKQGFVRVNDLCNELKVSAVTIRKDLKLLEENKMLFRSHGSASPREPYVNERPVIEKENIHVEEKQGISHKAAELVMPNDAIIIASGTTVVSFAKHLVSKGHLTVLTSAMNVTTALMANPDIEIIQLGGIVRKNSSSVVGHYAEEMIQNFACSKLFLGVDGLTLDYGLTTTNMMEAHLNRYMIKAAEKTIVLADSSKFGRKGFGKICNIEDVDHIITDEGVPTHTVKMLEELGIEVTIV